ncbi:SMP-30/gluconolactonase/LRE family protein [Puia dinghuensis]|uniref:Gluconolactonase n=1 Tax=Puia dinghuensis TaxID=1792502 RepID=A0A8J2UG18_9BACT|nr:SMP-30/gluconolactonase/LRE family protein [Puia dinghuensis]GGB12838.1 gluconolactonase [Puia dinghuensis]
MCKYYGHIIVVIGCLVIGSGCSNGSEPVKDAVAGKVELYDPSAAGIIDSNAVIEVIGRHYKWSEGPVWVPAKQWLLFSAVLENKIYRWDGKDTPVVYLTPSGYTDTARRNGENGSNGLTLDKEGRLLLCQSGNRQVVRMNASLDAPMPEFTVLAANYRGKKFNSPNDLVADSRDNVYFTDPIYGLPKRENDPTRELNFEGVYRIGNDGSLTLLIDSISRPNGIALSLDEKILYVGSSDDKHTRWYAYRLDSAGGIQSGGILLEGAPLKEKARVKQGADGFKIDRAGNIFATGPDGVNIISPAGKLLGLIRVYNRPASNCAFNETKDVLYITASDEVLRVKIR